MDNVNMQLPPPNVSGVAIPGCLVVSSTHMDNYRQTLERRRDAQRALDMRSKKFSVDDNKPTPKPVKYFLGALAIVASYFGIKSLIHRFKK